MARMLYFKARLWFSSTFTFVTFTEATFSRAISSSSGAINLHGPHHSAQKSTITGLSLRVTSRAEVDSSTVMVAEFSMPLQKVIPNLHNQNHSGNAKHGPAEGLWTCSDNFDRILRHGARI